MDLKKLSDHAETATPIHPALDIVDDVLYVTVQMLMDGHPFHIVLTSEGEALEPAEWISYCTDRGLAPRVVVDLHRCGQRWPAISMRKTLQALEQGNSKALAPTWATAYKAIHRALDERLQLAEPEYLDVLTLYSMMTYFHPLFDFLPILHLLGPAESGKSRAAAALAAVNFNGCIAGAATRATIVRYAHQGRFSQVLAEGDHLAELGSGNELVRALQAGCTKAEAAVEVAEVGKGKAYTPVTYYLFSPRIILSTKPFKSHPLRSRCIRLDLVKSANPDANKLSVSPNDDAEWAKLRSDLYRLQLCRWKAVAKARKKVLQRWQGPSFPRGRALDKWLPLATMASLVSDGLLERVRQLAYEDMIQHQQDASMTPEALLFHFARWLVREGADKDYSRRELYELFRTPAQGDTSRDPVPLWAQDAGVETQGSDCKRVASGPQVLIREMRRLHLLQGPSDHRRTGNTYRLSCQDIRGRTEGYVGEEDPDVEAAA